MERMPTNALRKEVVAVTNALAFRRLDARIAGFLLESTAEAAELRSTHYGVAMEVGSRREVVSRVLKGFEQAGIVSLERGAIRVLDRQALAERAGSEGDPAAGGPGDHRLVRAFSSGWGAAISDLRSHRSRPAAGGFHRFTRGPHRCAVQRGVEPGAQSAAGAR